MVGKTGLRQGEFAKGFWPTRRAAPTLIARSLSPRSPRAHGNRFLRSCCPSDLYPTFVAPIVAWLRCRSGEGPQSNALMA
jgi:hypothetical protein